MTAGALFDAGVVSRRSGTRAVVHRPVGEGLPCPCCGGPVGRTVTATEALFFHGGYGASRVHRTLFCVRSNGAGVELGCGWILTVEISEARPPRRRWVAA